MVLLSKNAIGRTEAELQPIGEFRVAWSTPLGLCERLDEAVSRCVGCDLDPDLNIVAVVLAVGVDGTYYELM